MYKLFQDEQAMHQWLRVAMVNKPDFSLLISNLDYLDSFLPKNTEEKRVLRSYKKCAGALLTNTVISDDDDISLDKKDVLRPDFVLYAAEVEGIVIVELKNIPGPTRQAGTEFGAYAGEIRTYLPFLPEGDLYYVLVSTAWPTLLCHYIFHEIFWHRKNILCLEPVPGPQEVSLQIIDIARLLRVEPEKRLGEQHVRGFNISLYDNTRYHDAQSDRLSSFQHQMKAALTMMSDEANRQNAHGFAFLWKDHDPQSLAPYNIALFNLSPFKSIERFLQPSYQHLELKDIQFKFMEVLRDGLITHRKRIRCSNEEPSAMKIIASDTSRRCS